MEPSDWCLTAEDLDFLERDAIQKLSQRNSASSAAAHANPQLPFHPVPSPSGTSGWEAPTGVNKVGAIPPSSGRNVNAEFGRNDKAVEKPKLSVKFFPYAGGAIGAKFAYHSLLVGAFRRIPKASWHANERIWMFPLSSLSVAEEVLSGINDVNVEVQSLDILVQRALCAASSLPNLQGLYDKMPNLLESRLLPFQRDGVRFILQHGGRALLADEMGLGKTLQAIATAACIQDQWPVLVLTPSSLRLHWASMIQQWLDIPASDILVVLSQYCGSNRLGFKVVYSSGKPVIHLDGVFNILSYDVVPKLHDLLLASEFKIVIADESHFLKNAQAKRTSSCLPILQKARYAILLSGTPALSRPIELFKQLEALYPGVYQNVHQYGKRYCKGGLFGLYQGASNQEELHNLMKATVMIRRLKKDVLSELPVKRRQQVFLNLNDKDTRDMKIFFHELEALKGSIATYRSSEKAESLEMSRKNIISKLYTSSADAKIPAVLDYLSTVVDAGCKFLIFAHHQAMIDSIHEYLRKKVGCIRIDGGTPSSSRQALVNDFQEREDIRAAVLSIKAGGIGLTLSAASTVIFAELSWNPGDLCQAEDRAHRIGQASSVNVYYLLASDTIDDMIWEVVQSKLENLRQVLDGGDGTLEACTSGSIPNPAKQGTLDAFLRRCDNNFEEQPKLKVPKKQTM